MPRVAGNWSEFLFVHYSGRRSHFSAGGMQIVLNQVFKYFSRAGVSYFYPLHIPTLSNTLSNTHSPHLQDDLWNIVSVRMDVIKATLHISGVSFFLYMYMYNVEK